mgnify:CR=1 FL=1
MKKYSVTYASGSNGYGWEHEYDRIDEFEDFIDEIRKEYTARLLLWDNEIKKFIFWKDCLTYSLRIDFLQSYDRDLRTKNRKSKLQ